MNCVSRDDCSATWTKPTNARERSARITIAHHDAAGDYCAAGYRAPNDRCGRVGSRRGYALTTRTAACASWSLFTINRTSSRGYGLLTGVLLVLGVVAPLKRMRSKKLQDLLL